MRSRRVLRFCCFSLLALMAACGTKERPIGSVVKGDRLAVMDASQSRIAVGSEAEVPFAIGRGIVNLSWPQVGYDVSHAMPNVEASDNPRVVWEASIGDGSDATHRLLAAPVVSPEAIFVMDAVGRVSARNLNDGEALWSRSTTPDGRDDEAMGGGLALDGDSLYATTGFGDVWAFDAKTGGVLWHRALLKPLRAAPAVADRRVFVVSIDNTMTALNAKTGDVLWTHSGIAESATLMGASSPAVSGDQVMVAYNSGEIFALRVQNGRVLWSYSLALPTQVGALPALADIRGQPVSDRGHLYAISHGGRFAAIDQTTGERVWEADIGGINTPIVSGTCVFVYGGNGQLAALSRYSGRALWEVSLPQRSDPDDPDSDPLVWTGPVLIANTLWMVNSAGELVPFSATDGTRLGTQDLDAPLYISPVVAARTLYVITDDGDLKALR
ncbi:MAG: PQQ-binding-like beta-propeller repeat protein [Alphaproteobacteria bacterium]|nr:PQQ-binding-like beta-propeller repeat protein [Alphaproteobacteria bacterium]